MWNQICNKLNQQQQYAPLQPPPAIPQMFQDMGFRPNGPTFVTQNLNQVGRVPVELGQSGGQNCNQNSPRNSQVPWSRRPFFQSQSNRPPFSNTDYRKWGNESNPNERRPFFKEGIWVATKDANGCIYFYHNETRETVWRYPEGPNVRVVPFEQLKKNASDFSESRKEQLMENTFCSNQDGINSPGPSKVVNRFVPPPNISPQLSNNKPTPQNSPAAIRKSITGLPPCHDFSQPPPISRPLFLPGLTVDMRFPPPMAVAPSIAVSSHIAGPPPILASNPNTAPPPVAVPSLVSAPPTLMVSSAMQVPPPVMVSSPMQVPPPVMVSSPMQVPPPVMVSSPMQIRPPVMVSSTMQVLPPVMVSSPIKEPPPVMVSSPIKVPPPVMVASPIQVPPPVMVASPIQGPPPVAISSLMAVPPPVVVSSPMTAPSPAEASPPLPGSETNVRVPVPLPVQFSPAPPPPIPSYDQGNDADAESGIDPAVVAKALEWSEHISPEGLPYYFNSKNGVSTWQKPEARIKFEKMHEALKQSSTILENTTKTPSFREERLKLDTKMGTSPASESKSIHTIKSPEEKIKPLVSKPVLGTIWSIVSTNDGRLFYFNQATRKSIWNRPEDLIDHPGVEEAIKFCLTKVEERNEKKGQIEKNKVVQPQPPSSESEEKDPSSQVILKLKNLNEILESNEDDQNNSDNVQELESIENIKSLKNLSATDAETLAAKERAEVPLEVRMQKFRDLLLEKNVSAFSQWEVELKKIVFDPRYLLLTCKERKVAYDLYVQERATEEARESKIRLKNAKDDFLALVKEAQVANDGVLTFVEFELRYGNDLRMTQISKTKDRKRIFMEYTQEKWRKKFKAEKEKEEKSGRYRGRMDNEEESFYCFKLAKAEYESFLNNQIRDYHLTWFDVYNDYQLETDPRFYLLTVTEMRDIFRSHRTKLKERAKSRIMSLVSHKRKKINKTKETSPVKTRSPSKAEYKKRRSSSVGSKDDLDNDKDKRDCVKSDADAVEKDTCLNNSEKRISKSLSPVASHGLAGEDSRTRQEKSDGEIDSDSDSDTAHSA